jgi:hypothetical protein
VEVQGAEKPEESTKIGRQASKEPTGVNFSGFEWREPIG